MNSNLFDSRTTRFSVSEISSFDVGPGFVMMALIWSASNLGHGLVNLQTFSLASMHTAPNCRGESIKVVNAFSAALIITASFLNAKSKRSSERSFL